MWRKQYIQFPAFLVNQAEQNKPSQWEERGEKKYWPFGARGSPDSERTAAVISLSRNVFSPEAHCDKCVHIHLVPSGL